MKPNPNCPACEGRGVPEYRTANNYAVEATGELTGCQFCNESFADIHAEADRLAIAYSGKWTKELTPELQDSHLRGDDAALYRRLLKWLWANPEESLVGPDGFPKDARTNKSIKRSVPFAKLFSFERAVRSKKLCKPVYMRESGDVVVSVPSILKAWAEACKVIKQSRLPILNYIRVSTHHNSIEITATDLEDWIYTTVPATVSMQGDFLLPAKRFLAALRVCDKRGTISFEKDNTPNVESIIVRHQSSTWHFIPLPVDNFPVQRRDYDAEKTA